jgi:hypothetical protein
MGHERRFRRKLRTSAFRRLPTLSPRRTVWRAIGLSRDEARWIAANIAKLPGLLAAGEQPEEQQPKAKPLSYEWRGECC